MLIKKSNLFCFDMHRYDLLCLEGIAQALRIFNGQQEMPKYNVANINRESMIKMHVKPEVVYPQNSQSNDHFFSLNFYCDS